MRFRWRYVFIPLLTLVVLLVGVLTGIVLDRQVPLAFAQPAVTSNSQSPNMQLIDEAWGIIQQNYVDRSALVSQTLTYGAIGGMVDALGDTGHTTFLTPQMVKEESDFTQGQFEGIGAEVEKKGDNVVIVAPMDGSPAQKAGLRPGDVILKVNGADVTGQPLDQVVNRILGPAGTSVTLTVSDPTTGATRDLTIVREKIVLHNVTWQQLPGTTIADVRVVSFSSGVTRDLKTALNQIQQQKLTGIILDLRNNPGGLLGEAEGTTSQFLASGNVLLERDAEGKTTPAPVESGGVATTIPMVVLVNSGTASASEIVAGALQDAQRAPLVGETTFGTGTVLNEFRLADGSALLLATEEWLTPKGRVIWHHGITPDDTVTLAAGVIPLTPEAERSMTASQVQASGDQQLLKALDILSNPASTHTP